MAEVPGAAPRAGDPARLRLPSPRRLWHPGLRARITMLATGLVALVGAVLLVLGWQLVGTVVSATPSLPPGTTVRVHGVPVAAGDLAETLGASAQWQVLRGGLIAFGCVVLAAAMLAWVLTGRLLRPVHDVTETARRLSVESLGERIPLRGPHDEVRELAETFDAMLDRLETSFAAQRRFVADASHELRTPLSVMRTELDVSLSDPDADVTELRRMAEVVRTATIRATQLVESLLLLARTDGAGLSRREPVDLARVAHAAWEPVRRDAEAMGLRVHFGTAPAPTSGDPALLERVAGNLLENAVRHNVERGTVDVLTSADPTSTMLRVTASGPVIAQERVAELFEPFRRAGAGRTASSGAGLGLAIVRAVTAAHGGDIYAEPVPGGGLSITVCLPATP